MVADAMEISNIEGWDGVTVCYRASISRIWMSHWPPAGGLIVLPVSSLR